MDAAGIAVKSQIIEGSMRAKLEAAMKENKQNKRSKTVNLGNKMPDTKTMNFDGEDLPDRDDGSEDTSNSVDSENETPENALVKKIANLNIDSPKAIFMIRVYKAQLPKWSLFLPRIDLKRSTNILEKKDAKQVMEKYLEQIFEEFVVKGLAKDYPKSQEYILKNFQDIYEKYGKREESIGDLLDTIKNLAEVEFFNSDNPENDQACQEYIKCDTIQPKNPAPELNIIIDFKYAGGNEIDSPASKFLPSGSQLNKEQKKISFQLIRPKRCSQLLDEKSSVKKCQDLLKTSAMEDIDLERDRAFFIVVDNLETNDGQVSKSYNNSPAKSAKSTTSKRRRRPSAMGSTLQKELINLKKPNILHVKTFDADLHKSLRPVFIFDEEFLDKVNMARNLLLLTKSQKITFLEIVFYHPEDFVYILEDFEYTGPKVELLRKLEFLIKQYEETGRKKAHIRLVFEEIVVYLNRVGMLSDKFSKQAGNMFKYDNEDIIAIYEVFILTKNFEDFCETLRVFQSSKYFEKNQKAKIDMIQGEKKDNLLTSIHAKIEEFLLVYYDLTLRRILTKMVDEANDDLIKFYSQYQYLTEKPSQELSCYVGFNIQLRQFLEKHRKQKYFKKMSIKTETVFAPVASKEDTAAKAKLKEVTDSADFKVD